MIVPSIVTVVFFAHVAAVAVGATETSESATAEAIRSAPSCVFFIYFLSRGRRKRELPTDLRGKIPEVENSKSDKRAFSRNDLMTFSGVFAGFCSAVRGFSGVA